MGAELRFFFPFYLLLDYGLEQWGGRSVSEWGGPRALLLTTADRAMTGPDTTRLPLASILLGSIDPSISKRYPEPSSVVLIYGLHPVLRAATSVAELLLECQRCTARKECVRLPYSRGTLLHFTTTLSKPSVAEATRADECDHHLSWTCISGAVIDNMVRASISSGRMQDGPCASRGWRDSTYPLTVAFTSRRSDSSNSRALARPSLAAMSSPWMSPPSDSPQDSDCEHPYVDTRVHFRAAPRMIRLATPLHHEAAQVPSAAGTCGRQVTFRDSGLPRSASRRFEAVRGG